MALVTNIQFEHYHHTNTLRVQERKPRISWRFENIPSGFQQEGYEIELSEEHFSQRTLISTVQCTSRQFYVVPWQADDPLNSRQKVSVRVRVWDKNGCFTPWSERACLETGLLNRGDWHCERIAASWKPRISEPVNQARLYITAQGIYEAEINGYRVGDYFMAPGWTACDRRSQYQTYDITSMLSYGQSCIGVRVAEGWFCARIGFEGGHRNIWGDRTAFMAQLEITHTDEGIYTVVSDSSWAKYDATQEESRWSLPEMPPTPGWESVLVINPLPDQVELTAGFGEPVRRTEVMILDFKGPRSRTIRLSHAEVLEHQELGTRPLRICKAQYEPLFTFHAFRYVQLDGCTSNADLEVSAQAVQKVSSFSCSNSLLNKLYQNVCWGMRGNFLSVPTDCPQRHERLVLGGVPAMVMVTPNATLPDPTWCRRVPCAIWHDVTILAPLALMTTWMKTLPRNQTGATHLWDTKIFQLGDWLDPAAPPGAPWKGATEAKMAAMLFLIHSLDCMIRIAGILGKHADRDYFKTESHSARKEFHDQYVIPNGRITSDAQAAYALAICFDLLTPVQRVRAGNRLVELVAYSMLLGKNCPAWLYPVMMGATPVWERWDSILPDGSINPGEMTPFNHYAFGAIAKFLLERVAGLQRLAACSWETTPAADGSSKIRIEVSVPYDTTCQVIYPDRSGEKTKFVGYGEWSFEATFNRDHEWPVKPLPPKS
ncbi:alpha-L-rhamnosidase N-terminal domain-containing protein [Aspergillus alliaceus]|uniref:alpha-L-rhamnosidase n=1 Tax=Petromyces alliaceus TaxID=209559 RepID=A0A5N7CMK1_PETAA|nr:alpha-L-rhamnosidase N-terminal domain-containing protein [Aspergillus alliaceus]